MTNVYWLLLIFIQIDFLSIYKMAIVSSGCLTQFKAKCYLVYVLSTFFGLVTEIGSVLPPMPINIHKIKEVIRVFVILITEW